MWFQIHQSRNKPSLIKLNKHNSGQNASQIVCLMKNLPFICIEQKQKLGSVWSMMTDLLEIMQILYSTRTTKNHVLRLEDLIELHLKGLVDHGLSLLFKHHMLIHYPGVLRAMNPVILGWMMRYEAKHNELSSRAHTTNNNINIAKTLAYNHPEKICLAKDA